MARSSLITAAALVLAAATLTACTGTSPGGTTTSTTATSAATASGGLTTLKIGASATPHAVILQYVQDHLATAAGLKLDIREYADYILPNKALQDGSLDANYFQHQPYLTAQVKEFGYDFYAFPGVHIEPLGIYSKKITSLSAVPDGGTVGLSNDPANQGRGLRLLQAQGLLGLRDTGGADPTLLDVADNPHNLKLQEIAPEQLAYSLQDLDLAVINGNYAIQANLNPQKDGLALESGVNNPYANMVVCRTADKASPALVKLNDLLHSAEVKKFIQDTWPNGAVIPAF